MSGERNAALWQVPFQVQRGGGPAIHLLDVTIVYDPALLAITDAVAGPDAPQGATVLFTDIGSGEVSVSFSSQSPMPAGQADFIRLMGEVPATAVYGAAHVLDITQVMVNGGTIPARADDAIHVAAYFGETTGNLEYSGLDAQRAARVAVGLDEGFEAYPP